MNRALDRWSLAVDLLSGKPWPALPDLPGRVHRCPDRPLTADELAGVTDPTEYAKLAGIHKAEARRRIAAAMQATTTTTKGHPMKLEDLLARIPLPMLHEAAQVAREDNPAAVFIAAILVREMARRRGEPLPEVPALELDAADVAPVLAWLDRGAERFAAAAVEGREPDLALLGLLFDHVRQTLAQRAAAPVH